MLLSWSLYLFYLNEIILILNINVAIMVTILILSCFIINEFNHKQ